MCFNCFACGRFCVKPSWTVTVIYELSDKESIQVFHKQDDKVFLDFSATTIWKASVLYLLYYSYAKKKLIHGVKFTISICMT